MKTLLALVLSLILSLTAENPLAGQDTLNLLQLRGRPVGTTATFQGVVTRAMGNFLRVEDGSAGITIRQTSGGLYDAVQNGAVKEGTMVWITGTTSEYRQLLQINQPSETVNDLAAFNIYGQLPERWMPKDIPVVQLNMMGEQMESQLVRLRNLQFLEIIDSLFLPAKTYRAYENGDANAAWVDVRVGNAQDTELDGTPVPKGRFTLIGVVSQFHATDPRGGYQIIPINASDIIPAPVDPEPTGRMVTFKVNLGPAQSRGKFNPMEHKVWVRGSFNGWEMTDLMRIEKPGDVIHILTRFVEGGLGDTIQYKFYSDAPALGWEGDVGPAGEYGNRIVLLGQPGVDMQLPTVFFNNEDAGEYGERMVTFNVDMTDAAASGMFAPQVGDRVVVTGPFNNWGNNGPDFMEQVGDTLIFTKTLSIAGAASEVLPYKFRILSADGRSLPNDGWELIGTDPFTNRSFVLGPPEIPQQLPVDVFSLSVLRRARLVISRVPSNTDFIKKGEEATLEIRVQNATNLYGLGFRLNAPRGLKFLYQLRPSNYYWPILGGVEFVQFGPDSTWIDYSVSNTNGQPTGFVPDWFITHIQVKVVDTLTYNQFYPVYMENVLAVNHVGQPVDFEALPVFNFRSLGQEVWPGDTDYDGYVTVYDVMPLGQFYGETGPPREMFDISWRGVMVDPWDVPAAMHADATGDGIVNQNDLLPIGVNYGKIRPNAPPHVSKRTSLASATFGEVKRGDLVRIEVRSGATTAGRGILGAALSLTLPEGLVYDSYLEAEALFHPELLKFHNAAGNELGIAVTRRITHGLVRTTEPVIIVKLRAEADIPEGIVSLANLMLSTDKDMFVAPDVSVVVVVEHQTSTEMNPRYQFKLEQNYPNPFNPNTTVAFELDRSVDIRLTVYNQLGQPVATLVNGRAQAGRHTVAFDATNLASGLYFYTLTAGGETATRKMTLIK